MTEVISKEKLLQKKLLQNFAMIDFSKNSLSFSPVEVPEGFEPSTFSSVARRSNPIELWDRSIKISKKKGFIKRFYACCHSLNKNIIKRKYV